MRTELEDRLGVRAEDPGAAPRQHCRQREAEDLRPVDHGHRLAGPAVPSSVYAARRPEQLDDAQDGEGRARVDRTKIGARVVQAAVLVLVLPGLRPGPQGATPHPPPPMPLHVLLRPHQVAEVVVPCPVPDPRPLAPVRPAPAPVAVRSSFVDPERVEDEHAVDVAPRVGLVYGRLDVRRGGGYPPRLVGYAVVEAGRCDGEGIKLVPVRVVVEVREVGVAAVGVVLLGVRRIRGEDPHELDRRLIAAAAAAVVGDVPPDLLPHPLGRTGHGVGVLRRRRLGPAAARRDRLPRGRRRAARVSPAAGAAAGERGRRAGPGERQEGPPAPRAEEEGCHHRSLSSFEVAAGGALTPYGPAAVVVGSRLTAPAPRAVAAVAGYRRATLSSSECGPLFVTPIITSNLPTSSNTSTLRPQQLPFS